MDSKAINPTMLKEVEVLNIYPVKETITLLDIVIPKCYIRVKKTKNNQTMLRFSSPDITEIINSYLDTKGQIVGHKSFYSDSDWVFPEYYKVEEKEVLPEGCGLIRIQVTVAAVKYFEGDIRKELKDLPFEPDYIIAKVDNVCITNYHK